MAVMRTQATRIPSSYADYHGQTGISCHGCGQPIPVGQSFCYLRNVDKDYFPWGMCCARRFPIARRFDDMGRMYVA